MGTETPFASLEWTFGLCFSNAVEALPLHASLIVNAVANMLAKQAEKEVKQLQAEMPFLSAKAQETHAVRNPPP